jgi:2-phospho-L-lactate guanylyltransferase
VATVHLEARASDDWVLVPVKAFDQAKQRLSSVLDDVERRSLVMRMAANVLAAAAPLPTCVACDDVDVAEFARAHGASIAWTPGLGLNGAVEAGVSKLAASGAMFVTVVHADLPVARDIGSLPAFDGVTLAPNRRRDGTNLLRVPAAEQFTMQFGHGSFERHMQECRRRGLAVHILERDDLAYDVDVPEDLIELLRHEEGAP